MSKFSIDQSSSSPLKIGITGGIGSGKTTVCKIFSTLGIPVYNADDRAKYLMTNNLEIIDKLKQLFGEAAYLPDGNLNRQHIAQIAFNDPTILQQLNAIVHPAVYEDGLAWQAAQKNVPYTLKEAALLFESGSYLALDKIITVFAPKEIRLQRVVARDKTDPAEVIARMNKQMEDTKKIQLADFVIFNDGKHALIPQVHRLHHRLLRLLG